MVRSWKDAGGGASFQPRVPPGRRHGRAGGSISAVAAAAIGGPGSSGGGGSGGGSPKVDRGKDDDLKVAAVVAVAALSKPQPAADQAAAPTARVLTPQLPQLCKFFVNSGRCLKGADCPYAHVKAEERGAALSAWVKRRKAERRAGAGRQGCCHASDAASKRQRACIFAQWLVETFGSEALNRGAGVLDVAGGRGALTFELTVNHGITCTLVEPRPLKLSRAQHKLLKARGLEAVIEKAEAPGGGGGGGGREGASRKRPQQQQQELEDGDGDGDGGEEWWLQERQQQEDSEEGEEEEEGTAGQGNQQQQQQQQPPSTMPPGISSSRGSDGGSSGGGGSGTRGGVGDGDGARDTGAAAAATKARVTLRQVRGYFGPELWDSEWWHECAFDGRRLSDFSVVIGQHPDEATEPIVDLALATGRPFAVMPCCVFPRRFPWRRLRLEGGGEGPVVEYDEMVRYLVQKGAERGAREEALPFAGCNRVVWAPAAGAGGAGRAQGTAV